MCNQHRLRAAALRKLTRQTGISHPPIYREDPKLKRGDECLAVICAEAATRSDYEAPWPAHCILPGRVVRRLHAVELYEVAYRINSGGTQTVAVHASRIFKADDRARAEQELQIYVNDAQGCAAAPIGKKPQIAPVSNPIRQYRKNRLYQSMQAVRKLRTRFAEAGAP